MWILNNYKYNSIAVSNTIQDFYCCNFFLNVSRNPRDFISPGNILPKCWDNSQSALKWHYFHLVQKFDFLFVFKAFLLLQWYSKNKYVYKNIESLKQSQINIKPNCVARTVLQTHCLSFIIYWLSCICGLFSVPGLKLL